LKVGGREDLGLRAADVAAKGNDIRRLGAQQMMTPQPELSYVS
jgi:hypothetical protein